VDKKLLNQALALLARARFVPVVRAPSAELAILAGRALARGGCQVLEITFTTPNAPEVIKALVAEGHLVGAGTIMTLDEARQAWQAGACFVVSPHLVLDVVEAARRADKLAIAGALTPTEVLAAHQAGSPLIKIFPIESMGGPRYLKMLRDPMPFLRFFPTGGVTLADTPAYLAAGAVAVGVGTALAPAEAIANGDTAQLEVLARQWARSVSPSPAAT
jgi:2-dehydro-3-deoxyphosphogluconate aldolase/(4S)-4-hydroxy-2-oxoglutarate aldolase